MGLIELQGSHKLCNSANGLQLFIRLAISTTATRFGVALSSSFMLTASELYARTVNVGLELDSDGVSLSATAIVEFHSQFF